MNPSELDRFTMFDQDFSFDKFLSEKIDKTMNIVNEIEQTTDNVVTSVIYKFALEQEISITVIELPLIPVEENRKRSDSLITNE